MSRAHKIVPRSLNAIAILSANISGWFFHHPQCDMRFIYIRSIRARTIDEIKETEHFMLILILICLHMVGFWFLMFRKRLHSLAYAYTRADDYYRLLDDKQPLTLSNLLTMMIATIYDDYTYMCVWQNAMMMINDVLRVCGIAGYKREMNFSKVSGAIFCEFIHDDAAICVYMYYILYMNN